jgi:hypothetical protein
MNWQGVKRTPSIQDFRHINMHDRSNKDKKVIMASQ